MYGKELLEQEISQSRLMTEQGFLKNQRRMPAQQRNTDRMERYKPPLGDALKTRGLRTTVVTFVWSGRCNNKIKTMKTLMAGKLACICKKNGRVHLLISMAVCRNFSERGWGVGRSQKHHNYKTF